MPPGLPTDLGRFLPDTWAWVTSLNWSSFLPDIIVAIVTGVVVGLVLYALQKRNEHRSELRHVEDSSNELRFDLQMHAGASHDSKSFALLGQLTQNQQGAYDVIVRRPVASWFRKNPTPLIREMKYFLDATASLTATAKDADTALSMFLTAEGRDEQFGRKYINGKFLDAPESVLSRLTSSAGLRPLYDSLVEDFLATPQGTEFKARLKRSENFVEDTFTGMKRALFTAE